MNQFLVLKSPEREMADIQKVEVVKILRVENVEQAKDEFLIWLKNSDFPKNPDHYFLVQVQCASDIENVAFYLDQRRGFQTKRLPISVRI